MKNNLVIVESPAKAKTIKKYLGTNFNVVASMGHIRDLPKSRLGVDPEKDFEVSYTIMKDKKSTVKSLKEKASKSEKIYLATDPDREGESIAWHLAYVLGLDYEQENRITFNEITKSGILNGINHPRKIDSLLVNSQQARRVLDRLVGYKLSPFLCKKIQRGLSAGRVQSVALKIIIDRETEIENFVPQEYWTITAHLESNGQKFDSLFWGADKQIKLENQEQSKKIIDDLKEAQYIISEVKKGKKHKRPHAPFITSTFQQEAVKRLGFSSKKSMKIAQELYEGVKIDKIGTTGLITYMRTDSTRISEESRKKAEEFILSKWGERYVPPTKRIFKTKSNSQDAHEAIRPTFPDIPPEQIKANLTADQFKIYKLIWNRFISSQMADCIQNTVNVKVSANGYIFKSSGCSIEFDGFTILYNNNDEQKEKPLPDLSVRTVCKLIKLDPSQHFTDPPARYNEASLIKTLEEDGVGRPSTYSSIISTIISRDYIQKDGKSFIPSELGKTVNGLIQKYFPSIVDVKFTSIMESNLDKIEKGDSDWKDTLRDFYSDFEKYLQNAKDETKDLKIRIKDNETGIVCDKCGMPMVIKRSKYGKFIGCSGFPSCKNIQKFVNSTGVKCHKCGGDIEKKRSKKGRIFYGCSNYPNCDFASWNQPTGKICESCGMPMFLKGKKKFCENCKKRRKNDFN